MIKKTLLTLLTLVLLSYIAGLLNLPLVFIILFASFCYATLFMFILVIWQILPDRPRKNIREHKIFFLLTTTGWLFLFLLGRAVINKYYMPDVLAAVRISAKILLLIITLFLEWISINRVRRRTTIICACAYILFVVLAPIITPPGVCDSSKPATIRDSQPLSQRDLWSLPYLDWVPAKDPDKVSVTQYNPQSSFNGVNIYTSKTKRQTYLMDMQGNIVHTWNLGANDNYNWHFAKFYPNGDLLAIAIDEMVARFDWDSNRKEATRIRAHHDFCVGNNGDIYIVARKESIVFISGWPVPIIEDYIGVSAPSGELKKNIPFCHLVKNRFPCKRLTEIYHWIIGPRNLIRLLRNRLSGKLLLQADNVLERIFDVMHTNTVELLDRDIEGFCNKGDILISVRDLDLIAVIDPEKENIVWSWGPGVLSRQHHPTLLENGNVLIFDNGVQRGFSRVIELDPLAKKIVWEYKHNQGKIFYTHKRGANQRLPNGNTLITEGDKGRAFEVTSDGEIVWEFYNPQIDPDKKKRAIIYRMMRITEPENYSHLNILY